MTFDPYLHFQGNCAEAMAAYQAIFGGDLSVMKYADAPEASPDMKASDRVLHATLSVGGRSLMGSDFPPGLKGDPQAAVSISHEAASVDGGRRLFDQLSQGGGVIMDYGPTFWSDGFGMVKDRFGTHWMISAPGRQG